MYTLCDFSHSVLETDMFKIIIKDTTDHGIHVTHYLLQNQQR